jgi:hypothetical protein
LEDTKKFPEEFGLQFFSYVCGKREFCFGCGAVFDGGPRTTAQFKLCLPGSLMLVATKAAESVLAPGCLCSVPVNVNDFQLSYLLYTGTFLDDTAADDSNNSKKY